MTKEQIIGALIGLTGAVSNNGKTNNTDELVRQAILSEPSDDIFQMIHDEKYKISPNCETCLSPCGNTSDYDMEVISGKKQVVLLELKDLVLKHSEDLPDVVYRALQYLKYDLSEETYDELLEEMRND